MTANPYDHDTTKRTARHIYAVKLRTPPAEQLALDFDPPQPATGEPTNAERFRLFHEDNPGVYCALRDLALAKVRSGATVVRTKHLFEELRARGCATDHGNDYALNNIYTPYYARLLDQEPELHGLIPMRAIKAE